MRPADPIDRVNARLVSMEKEFNETVEALGRTLGPPPHPVPDTMSTAENAKRRDEILRGGFDDSGEVYEYGVLRLEQQRQQMQKEASEGKPIDESALVVVSQSEAYHEYIPLLLHSLYGSMLEYKAMRHTVPAAALEHPDIARSEVLAQKTLAFLDMALRERKEFANVLLYAQALRYNVKLEGGPLTEADRAEYQRRLDEGLAAGLLRKDSIDALQKNDEQVALEHANRLNQRILDVLSGKTVIVQEKDVFYPQTLPIELFVRAYEYTLEQEKRVVLDPDNEHAEARIAALEEEARRQGGTLPSALKEEYEELGKQQRNRKKLLQDLKVKRTMYLEQLLKHTSNLGVFQVRAEQVAATQRMFGRSIDALAGPSNKQEVPDDVKQGIDQNMETRRQFHLDRIESYLGTLEKEDGILSIGTGEYLENINNKLLRPMTLKVVEVLAGIVSSPVPESSGLRGRVRNAIAGDIEDAMGIPKNPDGTLKPESEWTSDERARVEEKAKSVMDAIKEFRYKNDRNERGEMVFEQDQRGNLIEKDHLRNLHGTIDALRKIPSAKEFVGQPVRELPEERVHAGNLDAMIAAHGGPAIYAKLLDQLLEDVGTSEADSPTGVLGESAQMMRTINGIVGTHIEVADAEIQLGSGLEDWAWYLIYALVAMGVLQGLSWLNRGRKILGKGAAGVRAALRTALRGRRAVSAAVRPAPRLAPRAAPETPPATTVRPQARPTPTRPPASAATKIAKTVSLLAILDTSAQLLGNVDQTSNAEQLNEMNTVSAAAEFWNSVNLATNGESGAYSEELQQALTVAQSTGREEWVYDELEILKQWDRLLAMQYVLENGSVEQDAPLESRRIALLKTVRSLIRRRSAQFPLYQPEQSLIDQPFTWDKRRKSGNQVNVNTSGKWWIFPVPFRNGPIAQARKAGFEQRQKDGFDVQQARQEFEAVQSDVWSFQGEVEGLVEQLTDAEKAKGE